MVVGRKALAYTSNTPGKTQQFNFFDVNRGAAAGHVQFSLADLPGVGFAKVPTAVREGWSQLLADYFTGRPTLKMVCHLVDGNVGPKAADAELMALVARCIAQGGLRGRYVVILTKVDKPTARKELRSTQLLAAEAQAEQRLAAAGDDGDDSAAETASATLAPAAADFVVPERVARQVRAALDAAGLSPDTAVIATSSKSKLGREDFWRLLGDELLKGLPDEQPAPGGAKAAAPGGRGAAGGSRVTESSARVQSAVAGKAAPGIASGGARGDGRRKARPAKP